VAPHAKATQRGRNPSASRIAIPLWTTHLACGGQPKTFGRFGLLVHRLKASSRGKNEQSGERRKGFSFRGAWQHRSKGLKSQRMSRSGTFSEATAECHFQYIRAKRSAVLFCRKLMC